VYSVQVTLIHNLLSATRCVCETRLLPEVLRYGRTKVGWPVPRNYQRAAKQTGQTCPPRDIVLERGSLKGTIRRRGYGEEEGRRYDGVNVSSGELLWARHPAAGVQGRAATSAAAAAAAVARTYDVNGTGPRLSGLHLIIINDVAPSSSHWPRRTAVLVSQLARHTVLTAHKTFYAECQPFGALND